MNKLEIIVATTRPSRSADRVLPWVRQRAEKHGAFEVEVLDLRDWPLPMFNETLAALGDISQTLTADGDRPLPTYSQPLVGQWNAKIKEGDAYLFVTAEYNRSIPAALKNAIDSVYFSFAFRNKPAAFIGYSGTLAAGARAVEHLGSIAVEAELVPLRNAVLIPRVVGAFDDEQLPTMPELETSLEILLDDLAWWSSAMKSARDRGELAPGNVRAREAAIARAAASTA